MMSSNTNKLLAYLVMRANEMPASVDRRTDGSGMKNKTDERRPTSPTPKSRTFSISSNVIPGLIVALDSVAIISTALVTYFVIVGGYLEDSSYYVAAIAF